MSARSFSHDVFISHASEDRDAVAKPLVKALARHGWKAWLDESEMTVGDSLSERIDAALSRSRFGVVVLSPDFFSKPWTRRELAALSAREVSSGSKVILPVWHRVDRDDVLDFSPTLADRLGAPTAEGLSTVALRLSEALEKGLKRRTQKTPRRRAAQMQTPDGLKNVTIRIADPEAASALQEWEQVLTTRVDPKSVAVLPREAPAAATLVSSGGRNDPCWCGSGKKYKRCHGA